MTERDGRSVHKDSISFSRAPLRVNLPAQLTYLIAATNIIHTQICWKGPASFRRVEQERCA